MTDQTAAQFGPLLRRHRTDTGLTQRMLADLSTVSVRAIRDLEQGRARPREDTVRLITDALRLSRRARADLEQAADLTGRRTPRPWLDPELAAPPTVLDTLVGRDAEVATMVAELTGGSCRLVTVTGLPGAGKTRVAVEVAATLHAGGTPVLWLTAPGAAGTPPRDDRLAGVLTNASAVLFGRGGDLGALAELVADRDALLVLDGGRPRREPLLSLLGDCPRLRVLITADEPGELPGERPFLLAPLSGPAATQLFLRHARPGYHPDAALLQEVCALVDGLPSALAAAASWLDVYGLAELRDVLRADPAALLGRPLTSRLLARVESLPPAERAALTELAALGECALDEVADATGRPASEAGLLLRALLLHGFVRSNHTGGHARFSVLSLVRALT